MEEIIYDTEKLKEPAEPLIFETEKGIDKTEGTEIISKIKEIMEANKNILALSAPQIGINKRIFCVRFSDIIKTFINPIIKTKKGMIIAPETFLSAPGKEFLIGRPEEVTIVYHTDEFKYEDNKLLGLAARIFDQTYQVLDGVTPDELGLVSNPEEDGSLFDLTNEEMNQVVEIYKKFIAAKTKTAAEEMAALDEDTNRAYRIMQFTEDVINGRTKVVQEEPKQNRAQRRANKHKNNMATKKFLEGKK